MKIIVNAEPREIPSGLNVAALLELLKLRADRVAIERNLEILPRDRWPSTSVSEGDHFEIVHLVGGG